MSRLIRHAIKIPNDVKCKYSNNIIEFSGPHGISKYKVPENCEIEVLETSIKVNKCSSSSLAGTVRQTIYNTCYGVHSGFTKTLRLKGVGYRAAIENNKLQLNVGYSNAKYYEIPSDIKISVEKNTEIKIFGIDKQKVGHVAAEIKSIRKPEPYKGAGIHILGQPVIIKQIRK